jgi:hypothetical protein
MTAMVSRLLLTAAAVAMALPVHASQPVVKVEVRRDGAAILYEYSVHNRSSRVLRSIRIGYDEDAKMPELTTAPLGWTGAKDAAVPGVSSPPGWKSRVLVMADAVFALEWTAEGGGGLKPGETLRGLSVLIPEPDMTYVTTRHRLVCDEPPHFSGFVDAGQTADKTVPTLTVAVTPRLLWPANGELATIDVELTVEDDTDKRPNVRLERVTCDNECTPATDIEGAELKTDDRRFRVRAVRQGGSLRRTYTIEYSATDAAGNVATARAEVIVAKPTLNQY